MHTTPQHEEEGAYRFANVCLSVRLSIDQMVSDLYFFSIYHRDLIFHMLIGLGEEKNPINFRLTRSKVKVTTDTCKIK